MASETIVIRGYQPLLKAAAAAGRETRKEVRDAFRVSGEIVRADAARDLSAYSAKSAAGLKVRVRQRGVAVEQSLRKTTGRHAKYGVLQMHILLDELEKNEGAVEAEVEKALDKVALVFNA